MKSAAVNHRSARLERLRALAYARCTPRLDDAAQALAVSTMTLRRDLADDSAGLGLPGGHGADSFQAMAPGDTLRSS